MGKKLWKIQNTSVIGKKFAAKIGQINGGKIVQKIEQKIGQKILEKIVQKNWSNCGFKKCKIYEIIKTHPNDETISSLTMAAMQCN